MDTKLLSTLVTDLPEYTPEKDSPRKPIGLPPFFRVQDHRQVVARAKIQAQNLGLALIPKELRAVNVTVKPHQGKKEIERNAKRLARANTAK